MYNLIAMIRRKPLRELVNIVLPNRYDKGQVLIIVLSIPISFTVTLLYKEFSVYSYFPFLEIYHVFFEEIRYLYSEQDFFIGWVMFASLYVGTIVMTALFFVSALGSIFSIKRKPNDILSLSTYKWFLLFFMILVNLSVAGGIFYDMISGPYTLIDIIVLAISSVYLLTLLSYLGEKSRWNMVLDDDYERQNIYGAKIISALIGLTIGAVLIYGFDLYQGFGAYTLFSLIFYNEYLGSKVVHLFKKALTT